jgi:hypothetical protein
MDSRESAELTRLAADCGLAAGVAYNIRFYPLCHEAADRVRNGSLGEVLHVTGSYVQDWLLYETDFNWRVLAEDGGVLRSVADIGKAQPRGRAANRPPHGGSIRRLRQQAADQDAGTVSVSLNCRR